MSTTPPPPPSSPPPPPSTPEPSGPSAGGSAAYGPGGRTLPPQWKRIVARFLDALILGAVFGTIFALVVLDSADEAGFAGLGGDASRGQLYLIGLFGAAVAFVWDAVMTKLYGGSPMKLAFGMRVVQADSGAPVEWSNAIIRWAVPGAIALLPLAAIGNLIELVVVVVSLVFIFTRPMRQAVWDLAAKTVVVDK